MTDEKVTWDDALTSSGFVKLETDEQKILVLTHYTLVEVDKFGDKQIEFQADCVEEDGEAVEKQFTTISNRLKKKLRPIFENKTSEDKVKLSILKIGDKYNTNYSIKELKD